MHVVIIGGGVIGALSAYYLDRAGCRVTVLEKNAALADGASGMNAAQLSYTYVSPLGNPAILKFLARAVTGQTPDVRVTRWLDPELWSFGLRLLMQSPQWRYDRNQEHLLVLAIESRALMADFVARHDLDFNHQHNGKMHLFVSAQQRDTAAAFAGQLAKTGLRQDILTAEECLARVPALRHRKGPLAGAMMSYADEGGDCGAFTRALPALWSDNVSLRTGTKADSIILRNERAEGVLLDTGETVMADRVLVAGGADSRGLLRDAGISLPLYPVKGFSTTIPMTGIDLGVNVTDHHRRFVFAPLGGRLRVSGGMHFAGRETNIPADMPAHYKKMIVDVFPEADVSGLTLRAGFRPYLPDSTPRTAATKVANLYINTGHAMLGWTLAQATAKRAADMISGGEPSHY